MPRQFFRHKAREGEDMRVEIDRRLEPWPAPDQFEKMVGELDDVVLGTPGVMVAGAQIEAEPAVKIRLCSEITGRMDDMIDGARHGGSP